MLRKTKDGGFERQDSDGNWQPVSAEEARAASTGVAPEPQVDEGGVATMIDTLVDEMHGQANGRSDGPPAAQVSVEEAPPETAPVAVGSGTEAATAPAELDTESAPGDFDLEVPGLVSSDSGRGTRGFKTVRERLKENARKRREPRKVEVGSGAAKVQGPAAREGTERRQEKRARERLEAGKSSGSAGDSSGVKQRYVNRPAPELLGGRPKWVQDLFEAHFRSEHTLGMRRQFNRMKISRQDYAIGWLTAFDKFREEPSLLRLKDRGNGEAAQ